MVLVTNHLYIFFAISLKASTSGAAASPSRNSFRNKVQLSPPYWGWRPIMLVFVCGIAYPREPFWVPRLVTTWSGSTGTRTSRVKSRHVSSSSTTSTRTTSSLKTVATHDEEHDFRTLANFLPRKGRGRFSPRATSESAPRRTRRTEGRDPAGRVRQLLPCLLQLAEQDASDWRRTRTPSFGTSKILGHEARGTTHCWESWWEMLCYPAPFAACIDCILVAVQVAQASAAAVYHCSFEFKPESVAASRSWSESKAPLVPSARRNLRTPGLG